MLSGVPQGTVMGPLLFLLFINDLPQAVSSHVRLFADDCLLYRPIKSMEDRVKLQDDLDCLSKWATNWGMKFNPQKCYILSITNNRNPPVHFYTLNGCVLAKVPDTKYLGVTISENLQWTKHIADITGKANRALGFLRRNLSHCPQQVKELAYFSLVRSKLEYACVAWDPYLDKDIQALDKVQIRAARFVSRDYRRTSSVSEMLNNLNWDSLESRRQQSRLRMMSKIVSQKVAIPAEQYLNTGSTRTRTVNSAKFKHIFAKTVTFKNSFFPRTVPQWNNTSDMDINDLVQHDPAVGSHFND